MSHDLDGIARLAWLQVWQITVVALFVGAVVRACGRKRPRLAYALWMLVVVKSIMPPVWSSPTGLFSWVLVDAAARPEFCRDLRGELIELPVHISIESGPARNRGMDWAHFRLMAFSLWVTGLMLCAGLILGTQVVCTILVWRSSLPADEQYISALAELSRRLGVKRRVRLIVTSRPIGPAAFGLFRPSILLPETLLAGTPREQLELVLAHELVHVRRGDVFVSKLQLVAQLIWWFNPLVWWANHQAGRERERCCDEEVISGVGCAPVLYARTLLNVLEQKGRLRSLVAHPGVRAAEVTKLRLESIMKYAKTDHRRASNFCRLVFVLGFVLLVPGTGLTLPRRSLADNITLPRDIEHDVVTSDHYSRTDKVADDSLGRIRHRNTLPQDVERDFVIGDYYRRTGKIASAEYYLAKARHRWPKSP